MCRLFASKLRSDNDELGDEIRDPLVEGHRESARGVEGVPQTGLTLSLDPIGLGEGTHGYVGGTWG